MTLEDFKIGCEQWTRDEILESLYKITKQNNKAIEYIEEKYDYLLGDETFLDHDERIDRKQMLKLIEILKGDE